MLRDKATAKSDHNGQFFIANNNHVPRLVVAVSRDKSIGVEAEPWSAEL
jgi:hypothetical protein